MPRKATGSKRWSKEKGVFVGRVPDASRPSGKSEWLSLGTNDPTIAEERLAQWIATGTPPETDKGRETFAAAAERILEKQKADGFKGYGSRRHRLRAFALPILGPLEVRAIKPGNVKAVLTAAAATRHAIAAECARRGAEVVGTERGLDVGTLRTWARVYAKDKGELPMLDTLSHLRTDISRILGALVDELELDVNVALGVELPEAAAIDERERMVLTDEEHLQFEKVHGYDGEIQMVAMLSRRMAGGRPSDWWSWTYEDINFETWIAYVRRPKTEGSGEVKRRKRRRRRATVVYERQPHEVPEACRAPLLAWRDKHGGAGATGYVFPVQKGARVGQRKSGRQSHAERFRELVWRAGIHRWMTHKPGFAQAVGDDRKPFDQLQVDTETTRAVDFYSHRRGFIGAMRRAGVNLQQAMLAAGHTRPETHQGYQTTEPIRLPEAVQPGGAPPAQPPPEKQGLPLSGFSSLRSDENGVPQQPPISAPAQSTPAYGSDAIAQLAAALAALVQSGVPTVAGMNRPAPRPNEGGGLVRTDPELPGMIERAHLGSNQGPLAPEAASPDVQASIVARLDALERALTSAHARGLDEVLVRTNDPVRTENVTDIATARVRRRRRR